MTFNLRHFPHEPLAAHAVLAQHPDAFVLRLVEAERSAVVMAARQCRQRLRNPPRSVHDYLSTLEAQGLPRTVAVLGDHAHEL